MPPPTIVAIGGGSLNEDRGAQQIEDYILRLTGKDDPRICYLGAANGEAESIIVRFYSVFSSDRCRPSHLNIITRRVQDIEGFLLSQDAIYIGGGNTNMLLAIWRQQGVDVILREAWQRGIVLCGSSAGANCWHESSTTDSWGLPLRPLADGLGFVSGSFCPHYDVESTRRPLYRDWVGSDAIQPGIAADNCVGVHYEGTSIAAIVSSTPTARAYRLERTPDGYSETEIVPKYLGN